MSAILQTSNAFASAAASGEDWRDVGRKILESLERIRTPGDKMNIGFVYTTSELAADLGSLLSLLKSVTRIEAWYGASGAGICGGSKSFYREPAAVALIGSLPENSFSPYMLSDDNPESFDSAAERWLSERMPVAAISHGILCAQSAQHLKTVRDQKNLFTLGGFSGASQGGAHVCHGRVMRPGETLSGVMLDAPIKIMSAASFGCIPAGYFGHITQCKGHVIEMIDDMPAAAFLHDAIDQIDVPDRDPDRARHGHVHAAFPVAGSDQNHFLARNIVDVDDATGHLNVAHHFERGDRIGFVYRDRISAAADLTHVLTGLYGRAADEHGAANLKPKAILYYGCAARVPQDGGQDEAALIAEIFGDVPMAGFYTAAEICNGHVYGYTGIIVLLL